MTTFTCKRCGYETKIKENLVKHLRRKTPCNATLQDVSQDDLIRELTDRTFSSSFICSECESSFNHASSLYRHKARCPGRKAEQEDKEDLLRSLKEKDDRIKQLEAMLSNQQGSPCTIGTQNNIHVVNNIQINNFGREDISYMTDHPRFQQFMIACIRGKASGVIEFLDKKHFNTNHPENNNLRKLNKKDKFMQVYKNGKWKLAFCDEVLEDVLHNIQDQFSKFVESELYEHGGSLKKVWIDNFMKEVGVALDWDLSIGTYEFDTDSISDEKKSELKKKIYMLLTEHIYQKSKEIFTYPSSTS